MLAKLQQEFLTTILSPGDQLGDKTFPSKSIRIYQNNRLVALRDALKETYPVCKKIVGEEFFEQLATDYINANSSRHYSLNDYGVSFAQFVKNYDGCKTLNYLSEVSELEWLVHRSLLGENAKQFDKVRFATIDQATFPSVKFGLIRNSNFLECWFPADEIWQFNQGNANDALEIKKEKISLIVYSKDNTIHIDRLSRVEFLFLQELQTEKLFETVCDNLLKKIGFNEIVTSLSKSIELGYIDSFVL